MKVRRKDESEQKEAHACNGKSLHGHRGLAESGRDATTNVEQCYLWQKCKTFNDRQDRKGVEGRCN